MSRYELNESVYGKLSDEKEAYTVLGFISKEADQAVGKQNSDWKTMKQYEFDAVIVEDLDSGGAYVIFPWDIRKEFGKGRVRVHATFDGVPYDGSVVNMGVKNENGEICYVIGVLKSIRKQLGKKDGDSIHVVITER